MIYLDSNAFIWANLYNDKKAEKVRKLMERIITGNEFSATSTLTFDEVFWIVKKERNFDIAMESIKAFLEMRNLIFLEVNDTVIWRAYNLMDEYGLDPRDAIHVACALVNGIHTIVSEDDDLDKVKEIKRISLDEL